MPPRIEHLEDRWRVTFDDALEGFNVTLDLHDQHQQLVIGRLEVHPSGPLPEGGYRLAAHHRQIRTEALRIRAIQAIRDATKPDDDWRQHLELIKSSRGRPAQRDDLWFTKVAARYLAETEDGTRDVHAAVGEKLGYAKSTMKDAMIEARRRGLVTKPTKQGMAGGQLTAKAQRLLIIYLRAAATGTSTVSATLTVIDNNPEE